MYYKDNSKKRLLEVMNVVDRSYKPKLNEDMGAVLNEEGRPLSEIAREIYQDWRPVHPYAKPYLEAMSTLNSIEDKYMFDSGRSIVAYFLSNASSWRGETAKRIKLELKKMLGLKEGVWDDDDDGEDMWVTINGKRVHKNSREYQKWYEEEGEFDDVEGREYRNRMREESDEYGEGEDRYEGKLEQVKAEISQVKSNMGTGKTPKLFERDGLLHMSAEDGEYFADYYGITTNYPEVDPRLEAIAEKYGMYWEWENPGVVVLAPE